jgi:hypothetical protein
MRDADAELGDPKPMLLGHQDHRRIVVSVPVVPCGRNKAIDVFGHQILARVRPLFGF